MPTNPVVRLRHRELDRRTAQPKSAAKHLLGSGWEPADEASAEVLGVDFSGDDTPAESAPQGKTAKELKADSATSSKSSKKSEKE